MNTPFQHRQGGKALAVKGAALVLACMAVYAATVKPPIETDGMICTPDTGDRIHVLASGGNPAASTYYVRTDGGDADQCTGLVDAPYPGSGSGQACAWKHPFIALPPRGIRRISSGDTLLIDSGDYRMGENAPETGNCSGNSCFMRSIPSGAPGAPTRVLGKSCAAPPRLLGTANASRVLNLENSWHVEVGCMEVTDQSDCVQQHSNPAAACSRFSPTADVGLYARGSRDVYLHDLNIHGMAHRGMNAGGLRDWTLERVKLVANGHAGWDMDVGDDSYSVGNIVLREVEIAWNGCGERWQTGEPWACWAQKTGGYGDGLGTIDTGGRWLVEDSYIHHNTSDGLDFRYADGDWGTTVTLRRVHVVGNAGNQVKITGNALIENSVLIGNCGFFKGLYDMVEGEHCRANGDTVVLVMTGDDNVTLRHNTIAGEGGVLVTVSGGDRSDRVTVSNNVFVGYPVYLDPSLLSDLFYTFRSSVRVEYAGNLVWNVKSNACPGGSICGMNPMLADMRLESFDAEPLPGSPVIDRVHAPPCVDFDFRLNRRRSGILADIGAIEAQHSTDR